MRTDVREERLLVISDLHLGNPFSQASKTLTGFLEYALKERYNIVINGDGLEILQADIGTLAHASAGVVSGLRRLIAADRRVYYIVGNHDIALEHLIGSWLGDHICPFLNVRSGDQRIRIEHGHLYDPFFFKYPRLYEWVTKMAGPFLHFRPGLYTVWIRYQKLKTWLRGLMTRRGHTEQATPFHRGAEMLLMRGFDAVIFGHTHKPEDLPMADGRYLNAGNWVNGGTYVEINQGEVTLKRWDPK